MATAYDDPDRPIWGAAAIGREINLDARQAYYILEAGHLDGVADKVGGRWVSTPRRLRQIANGFKAKPNAA